MKIIKKSGGGSVNLTSGPVTSSAGVSAIANGAITNAMLANGAVANLSGANTGDETAARIATALNAGTEDTTPAATDRLAVTSPAGGWITLGWIFAFIRTQLGLMSGAVTAAGNWAFPSTTRPTSAGTGTPAANSLITRADGDARYRPTTTVRASANVNVTSSTAFVNMTGLSVAISETGLYRIRAAVNATVETNGASAGGASMQVITPSATNITATWWKQATQGVRTFYTQTGLNITADPPTGANANWTASVGGVWLEIEFFLNINATGNVVVQVSQHVSNSITTTFRANYGFLTVERQ